MVDPDENGCYPIHLPSLGIDQTIPIDPSPLIQALSTDVRKGIPVSRIAARFHNGLAELAVGCAVAAAKAASTRKVVLSGGVWQNDALLRKTMEKLKEHRLEVFLHHQVPANDGGIALGQVAVLAHSIVRQP
jgi:hydrogenase maturation protein HypF